MIFCKIISLEKIEEIDEVNSIILPTESGEVEVLPNHSEAIFLIKESGEEEIKITYQGKKQKKIPSKRGIFYIKDNKALIIF